MVDGDNAEEGVQILREIAVVRLDCGHYTIGWPELTSGERQGAAAGEAVY